LGLWARSPNGTSVLDWALATTGVQLRTLDEALEATGPEPSPVLFVPHLSGAPTPWPEVRRGSGSALGLTLATTPLDLVRGAMEGIAIELALGIGALRTGGAPVAFTRVTGGGARSAWWMQLKADLLGMPVEVTDQIEPGTLGAALLAGVGVGTYASLPEAAARVRIARRFEPDDERAAMYAPKVERHMAAARALFGKEF
jgi:sugar (pentulose or hexulose) kinase